MKKENHLAKAIQQNIRYDGRKIDEYRPIEIEYGISATAEGSARVKIGDTEVIAGVKLEVGQPYSDTPDSGNLMVDVQLLPLASQKFESGPPGIDAIEIARVTDRGIRESKCVDLKNLCIKSGEQVWSVSIDVGTLNVDGNMFDVASLAVIAAIKDTVYPKVSKDGVIDYKQKTKNKLPLDKIPIGVTVYKIHDSFVVDPTTQEELGSDARLTITTVEDGTICAMQKGGDKPISVDDVQQMVDIASKKAKELRKLL